MSFYITLIISDDFLSCFEKLNSPGPSNSLSRTAKEGLTYSIDKH
jgi:hypothetical protein